MIPVQAAADGHRSRTPIGGSVLYLLMNLPLGIASFVLLVTLLSVGVGTAVVWVGVPILPLALLLARGFAKVERARIYSLVDELIPLPYLPLPKGAGQRSRWMTRLRDVSTWRDMVYLFLLFPLGVAEFCLVVSFWATSLALVGLPIYFRYLPEHAYYFPAFDVRWITVDSTLAALPWAALGVFFVAVSVALTRGLARTHVRFAASLLGPTAAQRARLAYYAERSETTNMVTA
jgi:hypothetical protein